MCRKESINYLNEPILLLNVEIDSLCISIRTLNPRTSFTTFLDYNSTLICLWIFISAFFSSSVAFQMPSGLLLFQALETEPTSLLGPRSHLSTQPSTWGKFTFNFLLTYHLRASFGNMNQPPCAYRIINSRALSCTYV